MPTTAKQPAPLRGYQRPSFRQWRTRSTCACIRMQLHRLQVGKCLNLDYYYPLKNSPGELKSDLSGGDYIERKKDGFFIVMGGHVPARTPSGREAFSKAYTLAQAVALITKPLSVDESMSDLLPGHAILSTPSSKDC